MPLPHLAAVKSWFAEDELGRCPHCGARGVVPPEADATVCLECGEVRIGTGRGAGLAADGSA